MSLENKLLIKGFLGDWPEDFSHENGQYQNTCATCKAAFMGHKRRRLCKQCVNDPRVNRDAMLPKIPTMDSAELFQHFRNFRHAKMGVNGLGSAYPDALAFIDEQVRIRVAEILKGMT